jgi:hypothetical protein
MELIPGLAVAIGYRVRQDPVQGKSNSDRESGFEFVRPAA